MTIIDPSTVVKWSLPFGLMITSVTLLVETLGIGFTILTAIISFIVGWKLAIIITEKDVDHQKLGPILTDCRFCNSSDEHMYYDHAPHYEHDRSCIFCKNTGIDKCSLNANRRCIKCRGTGIMKHGKISKITCTCIFENLIKKQV